MANMLTSSTNTGALPQTPAQQPSTTNSTTTYNPSQDMYSVGSANNPFGAQQGGMYGSPPPSTPTGMTGMGAMAPQLAQNFGNVMASNMSNPFGGSPTTSTTTTPATGMTGIGAAAGQVGAGLGNALLGNTTTISPDLQRLMAMYQGNPQPTGETFIEGLGFVPSMAPPTTISPEVIQKYLASGMTPPSQLPTSQPGPVQTYNPDFDYNSGGFNPSKPIESVIPQYTPTPAQYPGAPIGMPQQMPFPGMMGNPMGPKGFHQPPMRPNRAQMLMEMRNRGNRPNGVFGINPNPGMQRQDFGFGPDFNN
jgi:hypothetical protein